MPSVSVSESHSAYERHDGSDFAVSGGASAEVEIRASDNSNTRRHAGFYFANITIPQGKRILTATVTIRSTTTAQDDMQADIYANDVDDAANFTAEADVTSRALTTASVNWSANALGTTPVTSPDISAVIQEVVDRAGWASGNDIVILFRGEATAVGAGFLAECTPNSGTDEPVLDITYSLGGGGGGGGGQGGGGGNGGNGNGNGGGNGGGPPGGGNGPPGSTNRRTVIGQYRRRRAGLIH